MSVHDDPDPLESLGIKMFRALGYSFYRVEDRLRSDDQMVRAQVCDLLGECRALVDTAEADYRRSHIKAPTRAKPFPDAAVIEAARSLERLSAGIGALEGQVRAQPVPELDRLRALFRSECDTLLRLSRQDRLLAGQAELLRHELDEAGGAEAMLALIAGIEEEMGEIADTLRERGRIIQE